MNFGALTLNITANIQGLSTKLNQASTQVKSFAASMQGVTTTTANLNQQTMEYGFNLASIKRIVSGIVIAQVFYKALGAIQDSTAAVFEFANSLEYAKSAYTNLFNDVDLAEEFINVLKDFAATTPFDFSESEKAAKRLLAYGVEYKNVMYVMQGVLSAASMQGDSSKVESISRALGQIYTKGRLMNQEMNQLTEAGIPAWEILQEKIGLTADQIGNIGDERIPASLAINALVDGMQERFGTVIEASSRTLTGIFSNIKDNAVMIGADVIAPLVGQIKSVADAFGQWLYAMREIVDTKGLGGLFEAIVPPAAQATVRTFIANLMNLWTVVKYYLASAFEVLKNALYGVMVIFNTVAPIINIVADVLGRLLYAVTSNATVMRWLTGVLVAAATAFLIFKSAALGALIVTAVGKAIAALGSAIAFLATSLSHPIILFFALLVGGLAGIATIANGASSAISKLYKTLASAGGVDPDSILLPESEDAARDLSKFNNKLDATKDSLDAADDSTNKLKNSANKLKKGLLSFDEVFRLNDNDKGTTGGSGIGSDLDLSGLDGLGGLDTEAWIPDIPDLSGFGTDFVDGLKQSLMDAFGLNESDVAAIISGGIGAIIGAVAGQIVGGPIGAAIGALVGAITGYLWSRLADELGLTDSQTIAIPIGAVIGAAIGGILGGPAGAAIGAVIGAFAGNIVAMIVDGITTGNWDFMGLSTSIGMGIGAAIGFVLGGPMGGIIGGAIGTLVGGIAGLLLDGFINGNWDILGLSTTIGTAIGTAIGFVVGGPAGALIGAGIGGLVGYVTGSIIEGFRTGNWATDELSAIIGGGIGAAIGFVIGGPFGAVIGGAIGALVGWFADLIKQASWGDIWEAIKEGLFFGGGFFGLTAQMFKSVGEFFKMAKEAIANKDWGSLAVAIIGGIIAGFGGVLSAILEPIAKVVIAIYNAFCEFFGIHSPAKEMEPVGENVLLGVLEGVVGAIGSIPGKIAAAGAAIISSISSWFTGIGLKVTGWLSSGVTAVTSFVTGTGSKIRSWATTAGNNISSWASTAATNISTWYTNTKDSIFNWVTDTGGKIKTWWTDAKDKFDSFKNVSFSTWATNTLNTIKNWASEVWGSIKDNFNKAIDKVKEFFKASDKSGSVTATVNTTTGKTGTSKTGSALGHATGGVFDREHYARFAEGNKAEAIIPLENNSAMQPFVDAVSNGLVSTLAPLLASSNSQEQLQPLYVGTLIADDRGLKELERKMNVIRLQENKRR